MEWKKARTLFTPPLIYRFFRDNKFVWLKCLISFPVSFPRKGQNDDYCAALSIRQTTDIKAPLNELYSLVGRVIHIDYDPIIENSSISNSMTSLPLKHKLERTVSWLSSHTPSAPSKRWLFAAAFVRTASEWVTWTSQFTFDLENFNEVEKNVSRFSIKIDCHLRSLVAQSSYVVARFHSFAR